MKKLIIFTVIIVGLFAALAFITTAQNKEKAEGNPFGKDELNKATIDQLGDPNYGNQILPDELEEKLDAGESLTVYFYAADCPHCQRTTPVIVPMTEDMDIDLKKLNLLEFRDAWSEYGIKSTPTLVHFKDGKEVTRLEGYKENHDEFKNWFQAILDEK